MTLCGRPEGTACPAYQWIWSVWCRWDDAYEQSLRLSEVKNPSFRPSPTWLLKVHCPLQYCNGVHPSALLLEPNQSELIALKFSTFSNYSRLDFQELLASNGFSKKFINNAPRPISRTSTVCHSALSRPMDFVRIPCLFASSVEIPYSQHMPGTDCRGGP